jgi:hypothetical protein
MIRHILPYLVQRFARPAAVLAAVLVAGAAGWALRAGDPGPGIELPAHTTPDGSGLVDGGGPVTVELWFALDCRDCAEAGELTRVLDRLVADGTVTRVYHPVVGDRRLVPLAATLGCAADRGAHAAYLAELLDGPPGTGVPDADELIYLAGSAGLIDPAFAQCVRAGQYRSWARGLAGAGSPPAVRVDRAVVTAEPAVVRSAVRTAADPRAR